MTLTLLALGTTVLISALCGMIFIPLILRLCRTYHLYDAPNARKVHSHAVPRLGGIAFIPSMLIAFVIVVVVAYARQPLLTINLWTLNFLVGILIIYAVGIVDDIVELPARVKFVAQCVAAAIIPASGLYLNTLDGFCGITTLPYAVGVVLTVVVIVFITNALNLIDGIDGLAAALALVALGAFAYAFARQGVWAYAFLIAALVGVLVAFLYFNLLGGRHHQQQIFMGDSGSLTVGYILAVLSVKYSMDNPAVMTPRLYPFLMPYVVLLLPLLDVVRVAIERLAQGQSPFAANKNHIHHLLLRCGLSQHATLAVLVAWQVAYIVASALLLHVLTSTAVFLIDSAIYVAVSCALHRHLRHHPTP